MNKVEFKEKIEYIPYIPYIEYDNKINDLFETSTIEVNTSSLLYLPEFLHESNKSESNKSESNKSKSESNQFYKKFKKFKKYLCKLFI